MPHRDADKTLVQIPFGKGQDESTPAFITEQGTPTTLTNGRILRNGSIEVRRGFEKLPSTIVGGLNIAANDCFSHGNQLLAFDSRYMYEWSESLQAWLKVDHAPEAQIASVDIGKRGIVDNVAYSQKESCDAAQVGQYRVLAWVTHNGAGHMVCTQVVDMVSGARQAETQFTGLDHEVRLCIIGTKVYCTYRTSATTLKTRTIDLANAASVLVGWSAAVSTVTDYCAAAPFAWEAVAISNYLVIAYTADPGPGVPVGCMRRWDAALAVSAACTFQEYARTAYGINGSAGTDDKVVCSFDNAFAATGIVVSGATLSTMALLYNGVVIDGVTSLYDPISGWSRLERIGITSTSNTGTVRVVYSVSATTFVANEEPAVLSREVRTLDGTKLDGATVFNFTLTGQPYSRSGGLYVYAPIQVARKQWHQYTFSIDESGNVITTALPNLQNSVFLAQLPLAADPESPRMVVRISPYMGIHFGDAHHLPGSQALDSNTYLHAVPKQSDGGLEVDVGFDCYTISFDASVARKRAVRFGPITLLSGGVPTQWDGESLTEVGWHYYPRLGVMTQVAGGSMTALGVYSYCAVYVWMDSTGQRHYSKESLPCSVTLGAGNQTMTVDVDCITVTERNDFGSHRCPVMIELYRTVASGTEYYFVQRLVNNATAKVTFTDTAADTTIEANHMLPTRGGTYAGGCPGASRQIAVHDGRPWSLQAENPQNIAFGHYSLPGDTARFPDGWVKTCARGHAYTAIGSFPNCLLAFQEHGIDAVYGSGPNEQGQGPTYSEPVVVCESVGCKDSRSLVRFPGGYLFQSTLGLWAIDEGFRPTRVGMPVEDTMASYPVVTSAVMDDSEYRIVLMLKNSDGTAGSMAAWYYPWNMWSVWGPLDAAGGHSPPLGACIYDRLSTRRIVYVDGLGNVACERDNTTFKDQNGAFIPMTIRFGWLSLAGPQGLSHVWNTNLLASYRDKTSVVVTCCYDYSTATTYTHTWTEADVTALVTGTRIQLPIGMTRHEAQSVRITILMTTTTAAGNSGAMSRLEAMTLEAANEAGLQLATTGARR